LLITKRVDIRVIGKTSKNYLSFGYKFKNFDNINELLNKDILYNEIILEDWNEERYMKGGRK